MYSSFFATGDCGDGDRSGRVDSLFSGVLCFLRMVERFVRKYCDFFLFSQRISQAFCSCLLCLGSAMLRFECWSRGFRSGEVCLHFFFFSFFAY